MSTRLRIASFAERFIRAHPEGVRWAQLFYATVAEFPGVPRNTVIGSLHAFRTALPSGIVNPSRGLYRVETRASAEEVTPTASASRVRERDFYDSFATWLRDEVQEVTDAAALGGNGFGGKWGTPDVIGLYRPQLNDLLKFPVEVVAAEIKTDAHQLIVAFGQACAYKLFAHRVYLAVPASAAQDDLERLDALAGVVGIGLVKFNADNSDRPDFRILSRAAKHEPDYFYVNRIMPACAEALRLQAL